MPMDLGADFLQRRPANFRAMAPIRFLRRAADVFPDRTAVMHGDITYTSREHDRRCRMLASALKNSGVGEGDAVAILCPNTPPMLEVHFGVPMAGAILNTLNTRLDAATVAVILENSETRVFIADRQWSDVAKQALAKSEVRPLIVHIDDPYAEGGERAGDVEYEAFLRRGMLVEGAAKTGIGLTRPVAIMTAGAAPPAPILKATEEPGFTVRHLNGMTERTS